MDGGDVLVIHVIFTEGTHNLTCNKMPMEHLHVQSISPSSFGVCCHYPHCALSPNTATVRFFFDKPGLLFWRLSYLFFFSFLSRIMACMSYVQIMHVQFSSWWFGIWHN